MVGDGQIGFGTMVALSVLIGCLIGLVAVAGRPSTVPRREAEWGGLVAPRRQTLTGPPAADDLDTSPIARDAAADDLPDGR